MEIKLKSLFVLFLIWIKFSKYPFSNFSPGNFYRWLFLLHSTASHCVACYRRISHTIAEYLTFWSCFRISSSHITLSCLAISLHRILIHSIAYYLSYWLSYRRVLYCIALWLSLSHDITHPGRAIADLLPQFTAYHTLSSYTHFFFYKNQ